MGRSEHLLVDDKCALKVGACSSEVAQILQHNRQCIQAIRGVRIFSTVSLLIQLQRLLEICSCLPVIALIPENTSKVG